MEASVESVLIVDDDERVRNAITRSLGLRRPVYVAHDRETAHDIVRKHRPAIVVVDLRLGSSSGIEVIRDVKEETPEAKVILLSGYVSIDVTVQAVKAGADDVMTKPVTGFELLRRASCSAVDDDIDWADATPTLAEAEDAHIARVLDDCDGNVSEAARRLGIYRSSLQRKLRKRDPRG